MINFNSIKNKVSVLFIVFSTLITASVVGAQLFGIPYTEIDGSIEDSRQEDILRLNQLADKLKYSLSQWIEERHKDIRFVGLSRESSEHSQVLVDYAESNASATEEDAEAALRKYQRTITFYDESFDRLLAAYPEYSEIHLLHPESGLAIASSDEFNLGNEILDPVSFSFIRNAFAPVSLLTKKSSDISENNLIFALPTLQERDGATSILVFITPISNIQDILVQSQKELGQTGEVLFVNNDGNGIRLNEFGIEEIIENPGIRAALDAEVESTRKLIDRSGVFSLVASRLIPVNQDQSISIFLKIDESILIRKREERLLAGILLAIVTVGLSAILIVFVMHRYLGPLLPLTTAAETIAAGGYSTRVETKGANEVGRLEVAFNKMAEGIQEHVGELAVARDVADNALKAKGDFLATMSHEIRTPMNGVIGMIDLIRETKLDTDQSHMMTTVRDSAFSLLHIINDILDFSKIEAGKMDLEDVPVSIRDVVEGVGETLAPNAMKKNIFLSTFIDPNIPDWVLGDQVRLRQIMFNMGGNAVKFTENQPDRRGQVSIRAELMDDSDSETVVVKYSIVDNGIGIPEEAQASLFEAFSQVESSTTRRFGGTGLGLSICVRVMELMQGTLDVESEPGKGSIFSATIPHERSDKAPVRDDGRYLEGVRVLLVSGIPDINWMLGRYLTHWHADVRSVDGLEKAYPAAMEAAASGLPLDCVIVAEDFEMAQKNELYQSFHLTKELAASKFIFLQRGRRKTARLVNDEVVTVDASPTHRAAFVTAVAITVGRASPEIKIAEVLESGHAKRKAPTIPEAEEQGVLILVAEDNLTNQDVIGRQLGMLGYACEMFEDGELAFEAWQKKDYAILLSDCHMPNMDGFELTAAIRQDQESSGKRLPIIAITANALQGEAERCLAAGMDDYLSKPLQMDILKTTLKKWMPEGKAGVSEPSPVAASGPPVEVAAATVISGADETPSDVVEVPIDLSALRDVFGDDDETLKEILGDFVDPATSNVAEIEAAWHERSAEGVGRAAHKLKSSSRAVGATEMANLCTILEAAGKSDDWQEIDKSAPRLTGLMQQVTDYIDAL